MEFATNALCPEDDEEEKEQQKQFTEQYKPLLAWLKKETKDVVRDGEQSPFKSLFVRFG